MLASYVEQEPGTVSYTLSVLCISLETFLTFLFFFFYATVSNVTINIWKKIIILKVNAYLKIEKHCNSPSRGNVIQLPGPNVTYKIFILKNTIYFLFSFD